MSVYGLSGPPHQQETVISLKAGTPYFVPCHTPTSTDQVLSKYMLNEHRQTGIEKDQRLLFDSYMLKSKMKKHRNGVIKIALMASLAMGTPML